MELLRQCYSRELQLERYYNEKFISANELIEVIKEYIDYYNNERVKQKLKGLSPIKYRNQALLALRNESRL